MRRTNSRSALFLGEILLALLIFALSSAVCVGLLFSAYHISGNSRDLNHAVFCAQSAAETFRVQPELEKVAALLGGDMRSGECYLYYGGDWQQTVRENAVFTMQIRPRREAGVAYAEINLSNETGTIFEFTAAACEEEGSR
ncbi:MAG: hypothetical protein FWG06_03375 [Clostridiales bacterium]|nr:hypothetical protein [Clostridiales bacterium]